MSLLTLNGIAVPVAVDTLRHGLPESQVGSVQLVAFDHRTSAALAAAMGTDREA